MQTTSSAAQIEQRGAEREPPQDLVTLVCGRPRGPRALIADERIDRRSKYLAEKDEALYVRQRASRLPVPDCLPRDVDAPGELGLGESGSFAELADARADDPLRGRLVSDPLACLLVHDASFEASVPARPTGGDHVAARGWKRVLPWL